MANDAPPAGGKSNRLGFATRAIHAGQAPGSHDRRGDAADLRYLDLRTGEPRRS